MLPAHVHRYIFLFGVFALALGMMLGTVPTSLPQIILASNYVLEGQFRRKWQLLSSNALFWTLSAIYLVHVAGVFYSGDADAALHDIRTKMPLMFLPLLFLSTKPLSREEATITLKCFLAGCVLNTAWCHLYTYILHRGELVRNASRFMSHIRLGLYLNMGVAVALYFAHRAAQQSQKALYLLLAAYFLVCMFTLGLASGLAAFLLLAAAGCALVLVRKKRWRVAALAALAIAGLATALYIKKVADQQLEVREVPQNQPLEKSVAGNAYVHLDSAGQTENGYYVLINIQSQELQRVWNRQFPEDSFSFYPSHNLQRFDVLVRYMASLGLSKDSAGFAALSDSDKQNVRRNYTNHLQPGWNFLRRRTYELVNEYDDFRNRRTVNGHSFSMRWYFWKAAGHAIKGRPVFGYGTGDVQDALDRSYRETSSPLEQRWRLRPHNQFLTIAVALGLAGLAVFLVTLLYPVLSSGRELHILYWPFFVLAVVSFLFEDTLETQAGLTFFAFFNAFFLCQPSFRAAEIPGDSPESR